MISCPNLFDWWFWQPMLLLYVFFYPDSGSEFSILLCEWYDEVDTSQVDCAIGRGLPTDSLYAIFWQISCTIDLYGIRPPKNTKYYVSKEIISIIELVSVSDVPMSYDLPPSWDIVICNQACVWSGPSQVPLLLADTRLCPQCAQCHVHHGRDWLNST